MIRDTVFASMIGLLMLCVCDFPRWKIISAVAGFALALAALSINRFF